MAKTTINIDIKKPDDTAEEGYIYFALAESAALDDVEYSRTPIRVNLDASGVASIALQPNDDAGWSVSGNSYLVEERFSGKAPRRFYMVVPTSGSALDYADLATYGNAPSITANIDLAAEFAAFEAAANATYVLQSRAWLNVKDFGAVGNGATNDKAAIQAAIDALPSTGGTIYFPPGNYYVPISGVNFALSLPAKGIVLLGASRAASKLVTESAPATSGGLLNQVMGGTLTVSRLGFTGPTTAAAGQYTFTGIYLNYAAGSGQSDLIVEDASFLGFKYQIRASTPSGGTAYITARDCIFDGNVVGTNYAATPIIASAAGGGYLSVSDTIIKNFGHGFTVTAVDTTAEDVTIIHNGEFTEAQTIFFTGSGTLPSPLGKGSSYKCHLVGSTKINPYSASAGDINLTTAGSGSFQVGSNQHHGIYASTSLQLALDRVRFSSQWGKGYAVQHFGGAGTASATFRDCTFATDVSQCLFGGLGHTRISGCEFLSTSSGDNSAALVTKADLTVSDCRFSGIAHYWSTAAVAVFTACRFLDPGPATGSLLRIGSSTLYLRDCIFDDSLANSILGPTAGTAYYDNVTFTDIKRLSNDIATLIGAADSTAITHRKGTGTPEGAVTAPVGSTFSRTDGGAGTCLYVKESGTGNTGWGPK